MKMRVKRESGRESGVLAAVVVDAGGDCDGVVSMSYELKGLPVERTAGCDVVDTAVAGLEKA